MPKYRSLTLDAGVTNEVFVVMEPILSFFFEFFSSSFPLIGAMALVMAIEFAVPLHARVSAGRRIRVNLSLTALTLALYFVLGSALVVFLAYAGSQGWGLVSLPPTWIGVLITILVLDFATWLAHWSMHKMPFLWRLHLVHHSDVMVDVTTSFRQHPGEGLWRILMIAGFALAIGATPEAYLVYRALSAFNALLEHGNLRVPNWVDRWFATVWVTPNFHKLHHSKERSETDTNYGNLISSFDILFQTHSSPVRASKVTYGIDTYEDAGMFGFLKTLRIPFAHKKSRSEKDRL